MSADAQKLLYNYHSRNVNSSRVISETKVKVDFGEVIGSTKAVDKVMTETTSGIIHSGKNGAYIVPGLPDSF
ncbi:polymorphic toxin type 50 domain-containing protein [Flavobacterium ardleyense]|uniref:Polymorphic toxin type 50 domain-containing protein n=1 Tax=Flavobacterium ardleyense TaxID=2038737 RepID=A0ABW5Z8K6_9FLAO